MEKLVVNRKKNKNLTKEELLALPKEDLVSQIQQLEAHNQQLRNVIARDSEKKEKIPKSSKRPFDFSKYHSRPVFLRLMYFGWDYHGLAVQEDSTDTIEHHLFSALTTCCLIEKRETSEYHRCGRTDKGVSSFGQVISIKLRSKFKEDDQMSENAVLNEYPYCKMLNRLLPLDIRAVAWLPVSLEHSGYSARFDCRQRTYKYYFPKGDLDLEAMKMGCTLLVGKHDFRNLCKMDVANGVTEFHRDILSADILPFGENNDDYSMHFLKIVGNAFLWHQIRCIMGVLLLVGEGKENPDVITELLDVEQNPRKPQYSMSLDLPLNLFHCDYKLLESHEWKYDIENLKNLITTLQEHWTIESIKSAMIKDVLDSLTGIYENIIRNGDISEHSKEIPLNQSKCLLQGIRPNVYKPLLKRNTCESLEDRIDHYKKKQRLKVCTDSPTKIDEGK